MEKSQVFSLMIAWMDIVNCALVLFPKNSEVGVNETVILDCVSNISTFVKWTHCSVDGGQCNHINYGKSLQQNYKDRFRLDSGCSKGTCSLTIRSVQVQDFGQYCCRDEEGSGESKCSQLTVITVIECRNNATDGVIGGTSCDIPSDKVKHTCKVSFKGQLPPTIVWEFLHETNLNPEIVLDQQSQSIIHGEFFESIIVLSPIGIIKRNGVQCRLQFSKQSCVSEYDAHYAFDSAVSTTILNGAYDCTANASGPCSFSWRKTDDQGFQVPFSLLNFNSGSLKSGEYTCSANCSLKSRHCQVKGTTVNYISEMPHDTLYTAWTVVAGLLACVVVLGLIVGGAVLFLSEEIIIKVGDKRWELKSRRQKTASPYGSDNIRSKENKPLTAGIPKGEEACQSKSGDSRKDNVSYDIFLSRKSNEISHIRGLAVMGDCLYYVNMWSKDIKIYDTIKSVELKSILVPHLNNPWDLVKCNTDRLLYISEYENSKGAHVYKIDLRVSTLSPVHSRWQVADEFRKGWVRISVTEDNRIVVCGSESSRIEVYDASSKKLCGVYRIPSDPSTIHNLQQAKLVGKRKIVFAHGVQADPHTRICLVERGNAILIDKFYGKGETDLNKPTDIVATKSGNIFVADYNNSRILILNSDLILLREIRSRTNASSNPCRLFIDDSEKYLYIGENDGNISRLPLDRLLCS